MFFAKRTHSNGETVSCTTCHTDNPKATGKTRANKLIEPIAPVAMARGRSIPDWLSLDADAFKATIRSLPTRDHITLPVQEQLIVELYSK